MAFPVLETESTYSNSSATTTHVMTLPTGISDGDQLYIIVGGRESVSYSATGWTVEGSSSASLTNMSVLSKTASSEGSTVTVTSSPSKQIAARLLRFTASDGISLDFAFQDSDNANPNPPNVAPAGGSDDYFWIAACADRDNGDVTGFPTTPVTFVNTGFERAASGTASKIGWGDYSALARTSTDPGTFTIENAADWSTVTIAIHPAGGAGGLSIPVAMHHYNQMRN